MNYIAYAATAASIVGTVANSFQKRWCFWVWGCTNTFWCVFNILSGSYAQAILYAFNFAMAVVGLVKWRQKERAGKIVLHHTNSRNIIALSHEEHEALHRKNGWIKCNAPLGHIGKNCIERKNIFDCETCKYGEIYRRETED